MKTPTVCLVYDFKHEAVKNGEPTGRPGTVHVRVYEHGTRKRSYVSTDVRVLPHEWDDNLGCVVGRADAYMMNRKIEAQLAKCKAKIIEAVESNEKEVPTSAQMKVDRSSCSWLDYLKDAIDHNVNLNDKTRKHHDTMYRVFVEFGKIKRFEHLTKANLRDYIYFLSQRKVTKLVDGKKVKMRISQPTVHGHWKKLKSYIRKAIEDGYVSASVVDGISVDKGKGKIRQFLNDEEIERWCSVELTQEYLKRSRDLFIVQMSCGMSYEDFMEFDFSNHTTINGTCVLVSQRGKTMEDFAAIMLPRGVEVMERWDWKFDRISNTDYNVYLGLIAKAAGINKHITSHVARHTYACYCLRHEVNIVAVQRTLGHRKVETTQIYARLAGMDVIDAFSKMK